MPGLKTTSVNAPAVPGVPCCIDTMSVARVPPSSLPIMSGCPALVPSDWSKR